MLDGTDKPVALIEAKKLGEQLVSHCIQIVNYANLSGVPYAGLTDGNHWELYKVFDPAPIDDRLLLNISIADRPAHEVALNLLLLWRPNLASGEPVEANEPVLAMPTESVTLRPVAGPEVEKPPAATLEQAPEPSPMGGGSVLLSELTYPNGQNPGAPEAIRFPDESTYKVEFWKQLLHHTIRWLWLNKLLTEDDIPVTSSRGTHLVDTTGERPSGILLRRPKPIAGTPLVLDGKLTTHEAVNLAKVLLRECGVSLAHVQLQFGED